MPVTHLGGCVLFRLQAAPRRILQGEPFAFVVDARLGQTGAQTKRLLIRYGVRRWLSSVVSRWISRLRHEQSITSRREESE